MHSKTYKRIVACLNDLENGRHHQGANGKIEPTEENIMYFNALKADYEEKVRRIKHDTKYVILYMLLIGALIFFLWTL